MKQQRPSKKGWPLLIWAMVMATGFYSLLIPPNLPINIVLSSELPLHRIVVIGLVQENLVVRIGQSGRDRNALGQYKMVREARSSPFRPCLIPEHKEVDPSLGRYLFQSVRRVKGDFRLGQEICGPLIGPGPLDYGIFNGLIVIGLWVLGDPCLIG